ncbi:hypothetical protein Kpol_1002p28 [Vanderwaltozyma polyspora DSM 70294]|uniref:Ams2/SPT21 N-terminal domain-containing protein n=1 Tax=Vanderwaltozyma polyspora (strain ATCC 22028 / DSM 70294 / BCRC 21397 / CBS 2163 / NBRC 10782 / NRRL Y-8283 / UCD 57-17) TaxID=436907 RepID=A7TE60_VANPO|nr:uncharacterized protein Kpol_1002p28 [Vanderwaltozyma polyspora DSM 70294]EDO19382.1 hypothetical protein Kpol_1002p28 [Vanderwaltozyma polyspora DSM 70294]
MEKISRMNLKIIYDLDNNTNNTYLALSKKKAPIRILKVPQSSTDQTSDTIPKFGITYLSKVLDVILESSPELIDQDTLGDIIDYNLYYKDFYEKSEPFVSIGLLSKLQKKIAKGIKVENNEPIDDLIVMGKIVVNTSNIFQKKSTDNSPSFDTLLLKLRLSKVTISKLSKKTSPPVRQALKDISHQNNKTSSTQMSSLANSQPSIPVKSIPAKRQTNPMPAPKAKRTQSLPIWGPKNNQNIIDLPTNSVAHKIYLADRKKSENLKSSQKKIRSNSRSNISSNSSSGNLSEDSVSKRFEFMLNKKKDSSQTKKTKTNFIQPNSVKFNPTKKSVDSNNQIKSGIASDSNKIEKTNTKSIETDLYLLNNTIDSLHGPIVDNVDNNLNGKEIETFQKFTKTESGKGYKTDVPLYISSSEVNGGGKAVNSNFFDYFNFMDLLDIDELNPLPSKELDHIPTPKDGLQEQITVHVDSNECPARKSNPLEKEVLTSDLDRTSPIDTLSMPLMELDQKANSHIETSCKDQLRRIPILTPKSNEKSTLDLDFFDKENIIKKSNDPTSIVLNSSISPGHIGEYYMDSNDVFVDKRTDICSNMPSSPVNMSNFRTNDEDGSNEQKDDDEFSTIDQKNDVFSSFVKNRQFSNENSDSTPLTRYGGQSSDPSKPFA